jgi:hypothetical protein
VNVPAIREALGQLLAGVEGIRGASGYPPEQVGAVPFAFVGFLRDVPTMGNRELHLYTLPITVLVNRKGANLGAEIRATEALIPTLLDAIRANQDLGIQGVYRVEPTRIDEGVYQFANVDYTGFVMTVDVKETFGATYA